MFTPKILQIRPTVMLNSSNCNLCCLYCYCQRGRFLPQSKMNESVLEIIIRKFVQAYPIFISFCWHGGEPLFERSVTFYERLVAIENKYKVRKQRIENRIQTNGTLITREWASFFKQHDFKVGISIDGPAWINDKQRLTQQGKGSYDKTYRGIEFLREADIPFGVIITVTSYSVRFPEEIYQFVVREGFSSVNLNPCFGNDLAVDPIEYAHFMNRVFDLWMDDDNEILSFGFLEDVIRSFLGGKPTVCHLRNSCYRHVKIDWNGDVLPCDDFLGPKFVLGNIAHEEISEIVGEEKYRRFYELTTTQLVECISCKWSRLCQGGCSRYSIGPGFAKHLNTMCESRKIIFAHVAEVLK